MLFFLADADLLIEFPMIQEGSDWRDVVVFLPCFGERFDVVSCPSKPCGLESPDRGIVASHTKPNHYEHHIVFKAVACWIYIYIYIDFTFLLRVNVENFSVEVRFVLDSAGWCLLEPGKVLCIVNRMSERTPDDPTPVAALDSYEVWRVLNSLLITHLQKVAKSELQD